MKRIAVLITCHNRKIKTMACLKSLFQCTLPAEHSIEVFLVDDGSTDGTSNAIKENFSQVRIISGSGNLYWNRGMHLAWKTAAENDFDYYLWLNDDTYIFKDTLLVLLSTANSTENISIIIATTCTASGVITYGGRDLKHKLIHPQKVPTQVAILNGNCVLVPNYVYQKLGNLDPLFHHAIGDFDYGLRAGRLGIKLFIAPGFLANCELNESIPQWRSSSVPLLKRIVSLYSPAGRCNPKELFHYDLRHANIFIAVMHLFSLHLRMLIPGLWTKYIK